MGRLPTRTSSKGERGKAELEQEIGLCGEEADIGTGASGPGLLRVGPSQLLSLRHAVQWREEGMRRGSASNSSCARRSINVGHFGVPMRRTSLSTEIVFGACMCVPFSYKERNAMLQLAPRGEIAVPILELEDLHLPHVKTHEAFRCGLKSHRRVRSSPSCHKRP
jgi:hypothetical protein